MVLFRSARPVSNVPVAVLLTVSGDRSDCQGLHKRAMTLQWRRRRQHSYPLEVLVPTELEVVAAFFCRCRRTISVDDADVEVFFLRSLQQTLKKWHKASMSFIAPGAR